ncbi:UbiD family decarboxylase [Methanobrevibacter filiformis]|uniref:Anhydromevalonate phosphate decarboxylase n=1 Tax=Methanobrevibacter filiformis TaxID=55758 RepID=A0A162FKR9_9EURY|nr:UbiD family decarboxylase [Methanobrevibacter filiformis]KZX11490.1 3-octaprenyl-4-hydroxybenzoate carboxy-lyase [Methanobrevibacter filiformis]
MESIIDKIDNTNLITITDEISTVYEATEVLKKYPRDTVILENITGRDIPIISGICNTREKIAKSINSNVDEIIHRIIKAMENPLKIAKTNTIKKYNSTKADLTKLPILTHYKKDGGAYITSGVVFAKDPKTGIQNASIHRMLVLDNNHLGIRLVPRNLYTYFKESESLNKDLDISIAIGMDPSTLLASTTSIPIDQDEMEVANYFKNGKLELIECENGLKVPDAEIILEGKILSGERSEEGPFVDLTDTYDVIRDEPVIELSKLHTKDNPYYHSILPAGFEHRLLQGLPQEPRIYKSVKNTVPTVKNVILTEGGCCWLHAAISIDKQTQGDGKNAILASLSAHPSLKHAVVVDTDINILDPEDIEYAIATRVKGDDDILIVPKARGSSLDPVAKPDGTTTKVGIDATKNLEKLEKFQRVSQDN